MSHRLSKKLHNRLTSTVKKTRHKRIDAGIAVASGTYGCVFRPPLQCKHGKQTKNTKYVSKLMKTSSVLDEIKEVKAIKNQLLSNKVSEDYINKYYILANNKDICKINMDPTDRHGQSNINDLHSGLSSNGKTNCSHIYDSVTEVGDNSSKYRALNMIDGGDNLGEYLSKKKLTIGMFDKLNKNLIGLLEKGVVKMNSLGVYHCDLKSLNIVSNDRIRIIDWGLSSTLKLPFDKKTFSMNRKKIQINSQMYYGLPFSNILVNSNFSLLRNTYKTYLKHKYPGDAPSDYFTTLGLFNKDIKCRRTLSEIAIENIAKVVFSREKEERFFNKVFLKNADIFGFLQLYIDIYNNIKHSHDKELRKVKENIKHLIVNYVLTSEYAIKPYVVTDIVNDLKNLSVQHRYSGINNVSCNKLSINKCRRYKKCSLGKKGRRVFCRTKKKYIKK